MRHLIVGLMLISAGSAFAGAQWQCTAFDVVGKMYSAEGSTQDRAKSKAIGYCADSSDSGICDYIAEPVCDLPAGASVSCMAYDIRGMVYSGHGANDKAAAKSAMSVCEDQSDSQQCNVDISANCFAH